MAERTEAGLLVELRRRARELAPEAGPPTLALGVFERVGSNWFLDLARPGGPVHNEPFRQQLHPTHPLSALNPGLVSVDQLGSEALGPFGLHGPDPTDEAAPLTRWLYGAAWNTPATWAEVRRHRVRHITGSSRGVGIRLVLDIATPPRPTPAKQIAERLCHARHQLADRTQPLARLDHYLIDALAPET